MPEDRVPPHNIEVERAVLGAMMLEPEALDRGLELLNADYFYLEDHRKIFSAIKTLAESDRPADIVSLADQLDKENNIEKVGGRSYLSSLLTSVVTSGNIDYHAEIIREKAMLRSLIHAGGDIVSMAYSETLEMDELLDNVERKIWAIGEQRLRGDFASMGEILPATYEKLEEIRRSDRTVTGLPTGYTELDKLTSGFHPADYVIIAARPSVGKTALAIGIAMNVAVKEGIGVAMFSLEMAREQLVIRMMGNRFRVDTHRLRTGSLTKKDFSRIGNNLKALSAAPIYIDDSPIQTVLDMRAKCRRLMRKVNNIGLIVVDYLQLLTSGQRKVESRQQEITTISRQLKALGRELGVPVIAISQLSRQVETREAKRPILADLRESGAIEQDADLVMFIYRPELYGKKKVEIYRKKYDSTGIAEIIVAKQRNGPIGSVYLDFHKEYVTFENLALEDRTPIYEDSEENEEFNYMNYGGS